MPILLVFNKILLYSLKGLFQEFILKLTLYLKLNHQSLKINFLIFLSLNLNGFINILMFTSVPSKIYPGLSGGYPGYIFRFF